MTSPVRLPGRCSTPIQCIESATDVESCMRHRWARIRKVESSYDCEVSRPSPNAGDAQDLLGENVLTRQHRSMVRAQRDQPARTPSAKVLRVCGLRLVDRHSVHVLSHGEPADPNLIFGSRRVASGSAGCMTQEPGMQSYKRDEAPSLMKEPRKTLHARKCGNAHISRQNAGVLCSMSSLSEGPLRFVAPMSIDAACADMTPGSRPALVAVEAR